jgi:hypothetical protein
MYHDLLHFAALAISHSLLQESFPQANKRGGGMGGQVGGQVAGGCPRGIVSRFISEGVHLMEPKQDGQ